MKFKFVFSLLTALTLTSLLLSACGGSGGDTSSVPVSPTPTLASTSMPTKEPTPIPPTNTPTPGIGSTMIGEDGMTLLFVPAGTFTMGSDSSDQSDEKPEHQVDLKAFWIDQTEVTNAMYARCVDANQCDPPSNTSSYTHSSYYGISEFDNYL